MAIYTIRTRNTDQDNWTDRYEIEDSVGVLDLTGLTAPIVQKFVSAGEPQIECILEPLGTRKFLIKEL